LPRFLIGSRPVIPRKHQSDFAVRQPAHSFFGYFGWFYRACERRACDPTLTKGRPGTEFEAPARSDTRATGSGLPHSKRSRARPAKLKNFWATPLERQLWAAEFTLRPAGVGRALLLCRRRRRGRYAAHSGPSGPDVPSLGQIGGLRDACRPGAVCRGRLLQGRLCFAATLSDSISEHIQSLRTAQGNS